MSDRRQLDRYELIEEIGHGGMGVVYRAYDPHIGREVALKTIELVGGPEEREDQRQRILREIRAAGRLSHPNIVPIHDVGQTGDVGFIVMELMAGGTLESRMRDPSVDRGKHLRSLAQVASALDYAAGMGVVHRDIKPANVLLTADGTAKLGDFGIARIVSEGNLTRTGFSLGTPKYMAPEQIGMEEITPAADQFALAVMAYEALTGRDPYERETLKARMQAVLVDRPRPAPELPAPVEAALLKGMARESDQRHRSCQAMLQALERGLEAPTTIPATPAAQPPAQPAAQRRTWAFALPILLVALLGGAAVTVDWPQMRSTESEATLQEPISEAPDDTTGTGAESAPEEFPEDSGSSDPEPDNSNDVQETAILESEPPKPEEQHSEAGEVVQESTPKKLDEPAPEAPLCELGAAYLCTEEGLRYAQGVGGRPVDPRKAAELFERACNSGHPSGCGNLGWMLAAGGALPQDLPRAIHLLQRACDERQGDACNNLGWMRQNAKGGPRNLSEAARLFDQSCLAGVAKGCTNLAAAYERGQGVPQDLAAAARHYTTACELGDPAACDRLRRSGSR